MKYPETMIAWNSNSNEIKVGPWPDATGWSRNYSFTTGANNMAIHDLSNDQQVANLFVNFNKVVVRDGVGVNAAHKAFLKIAEYRQFIAPDMDGADLYD